MLQFLRLSVFVSLLALTALSAAQAAAGQPFAVSEKTMIGGWEATVMEHRSTGEFFACGLGAGYRNNIDLSLLLRNDGLFVLVMSSSDFAFDKGTRFPIRLVVDGRTLARAQGLATGRNTIGVNLGEHPDGLIRTLRRSNDLAIYDPTNGEKVTGFTLGEIDRGLGWVQRCAKRHGATRAGTNPFGN
jgi:hypothetical protein